MNAILYQAMRAFEGTIKLNGTAVTFGVQFTADNGFGEQIPSGEVIEHKEIVRISRSGSGPDKNQDLPSGLGTNFSYFMEAFWDTAIVEGMTISDGVAAYRVGPVLALKIQGEVYGVRAPLFVVEEVGSSGSR